MRTFVVGVATVVLALGTILTARGTWAEEGKPVNLLRLAGAKVEFTSAPDGAAALGALADGDPATVLDVEATEDAPFEVVFGFGGADVAPEALRVTLPATGGSWVPAARAEVLVSTSSAHAGFRSARTDPLPPTGAPKTLEFLPMQARWILVRLAPAPGAKRLAVAEVEVLGREGMPQSRYAFTESPAKALDVLARLSKTSALEIAVTGDERAMFARAQAGRLDPRGFAEAALLASGVTDATQRAGYLKRLDKLEQGARAALATAGSPFAKGGALLQWLHQGPMAKGYVASQTDLSTVLDTGTFNCVSSATLYNCLALRLGLDARAIEVPTHAFSIVYEGSRHVDVETTTPDGFGPARDPAIVARFEQATGFRYIHDIHRDQRREVEEAGLAAIIYYNHGVGLADAKRYHEALLAFFRAMSLDPEFASAVKGGLGVLAKWGAELAEGGRPEAALEVIETGLALAPRDAALVNQRLWVWQRWSEGEIDVGRTDEALAILERAAVAVPDGGFSARRAWVYIKPGEKLADAQRWEDALAAVAPGLARLDGPPRAELESWRANLYLRWFNAEVRAQSFEPAAVVLERGLAAFPDQPGLLQNAGYLAQVWAQAVAPQGPARTAALLHSLLQRFRGNPAVADAAANQARRASYDAANASRWREALAALEEMRDLLPDERARDDVAVYVFDNWAKDRIKAGAWGEAAGVYAEALGKHPENRLIQQNIAFLAQEWSKAAYQEGGAAEAARVTSELKTRFPSIAFAGKSSANELKRVVAGLVQAGKHAEAIRALEEGEALFESAQDAEGAWLSVFDGWASAEMTAGRFEQAVDAYAAGFARLPQSRHLRQNLGYLAQEWGRAAAAKDAGEAIQALRSMRARFPDVDEVAQAAKRHVLRAVHERAATEPEQALADLESWKDLLPEERDVQEAAVGAYDRWAGGHASKGMWQEAVDVYAAALAKLPTSSRLKNNAVATWYQWAKSFSDAKQWDEAIATYDKGLERMPGTSLFKQNRAWCEEQKQRGG